MSANLVTLFKVAQPPPPEVHFHLCIFKVSCPSLSAPSFSRHFFRQQPLPLPCPSPPMSPSPPCCHLLLPPQLSQVKPKICHNHVPPLPPPLVTPLSTVAARALPSPPPSPLGGVGGKKIRKGTANQREKIFFFRLSDIVRVLRGYTVGVRQEGKGARGHGDVGVGVGGGGGGGFQARQGHKGGATKKSRTAMVMRRKSSDTMAVVSHNGPHAG